MNNNLHVYHSNEPKYCACLCVNNVLYAYNCIHEKAIKPSCILYLILNHVTDFVYQPRARLLVTCLACDVTWVGPFELWGEFDGSLEWPYL